MDKFIVNLLEHKTRLDVYLTKQLNKHRSYVDKLFDHQLIKVNGGLAIKKGQLISNGMIIEVDDLIEKTPKVVKEKAKKIKIVYEDNDVIVINKPKDILTHPTSFKETNTVINGLLPKIKVKEFEDKLRPGVVHRLDRNTTGLMVVAKNAKAYKSLLDQITKRRMMRKYLALVHHNFQDKYLLIKAPIDRSKQDLLKMVVSDEPKAKLASTEITVLENYNNGALIECHLLTGRTHQIRVHLAYIHHPVFNDALYGSNDGYGDYGQFLHAYELSFIQPTTKELLSFESKPDKTFNELKTRLTKGRLND
ncbi:MAG: RluA family pseudouridine synthase [Mycoplasmataceae bacterium]|jgi:23S rRNA pseudouridine1911/1915/1917 synthase|nr:RluA family pseudouridine synthase [Mycoplasmataceae bacterium]